MLHKETLLTVVSFLLTASVCAGQTTDLFPQEPFEISELETREDIVQNTAKGIINITIPRIEELYNLPENWSSTDGTGWSREKTDSLASRVQDIVSEKMIGKRTVFSVVGEQSGKERVFVLKDRQVMLYITLDTTEPDGVPSVSVRVYDCQESGTQMFADMRVSYQGNLKGLKWSIHPNTVGDMVEDRSISPPKCFEEDILVEKIEYEKFEHGDHYHYVPDNRDPDVPISRFPTKPPEKGEYITPRGEVVEKEQ